MGRDDAEPDDILAEDCEGGDESSVGGAREWPGRDLFIRARWREDYRAAYRGASPLDRGRVRRWRARGRQRSAVRGQIKAGRRAYLKQATQPATAQPSLAVPVVFAVVIALIAVWGWLHPGRHHTAAGRAAHAAAVSSSSSSSALPAPIGAGSGPSAAAPSSAAPSTVAPSAATTPIAVSPTTVSPLVAPPSERSLPALGVATSPISVAESAAVDACSYTFTESLAGWRARVQRWLTPTTASTWAPDGTDEAQWAGWVVPQHVTVICAPAQVSADNGTAPSVHRYLITVTAATRSLTGSVSTAATYAAVAVLQPTGTWLLASLNPQ